MDNLTIDQLRYFIAAARFEHVGRAARASAISPSALSMAIGQLEATLGTSLFDRIGRTIRLNSNGRMLLPKAEEIIGHLKKLTIDATSPSRDFNGRIRIGASPFLASHVICPAWVEFMKLYPNSTADLESPPTGEAISRVLRGDLDSALVFSPQPHPDLRVQEFHSGKLVIVVGVHHPILRRPADSRWHALSEYSAIFHRSMAGVDQCESHPELLRFGVNVQTRATFENDEQAVMLLSQSHNWTLLPDIIALSYKKELRTLTPPRGWDGSYRVCWIERAARSIAQESGALQACVETALQSRVQRYARPKK